LILNRSARGFAEKAESGGWSAGLSRSANRLAPCPTWSRSDW